MPGRMEFEFGFSTAGVAGKRRGEGAMRILMMGDFSGRANRGVMESGESLAARPLSTVDVDNFETLIERYRPRLEFPLGGAAQILEFAELDDFHPDALYQRLELFTSLRSLRSRLANPETFPQAAAELKFDAMPAKEPTDSEPATSQQQENEDNMFQRLLGKAPSEPEAATVAESAGVDKFIRDIVAPYVVRQDTQQQEAYISSVDDAISSQMRGLLHKPAFQALESTWRSVHRLVSGLETGEELKLYLLDVSKEELAADVAGAGGDPENSGLYRLLVEQGIRTLGGEPWSLLVGDYRFGPDKEETTLLAALGAIASHAGGPFLAAASPAILGCSSLVDSPAAENWQGLEREMERSWQALRGSSVAPWIGLALPRVLLRLPYGRQGDEIDSFRFEEIAGSSSPDHDSLLWGSPAYACAMLLGTAFQERGWAMEPGDLQDIEDLPAYTYDDDGERRLMPCAETLLSERTGEAILAQGLMPLLSYRNRNTVRVLRFQSIASPGAALSGPWG
ncbi:MAG: type VI secretion system contractile sheath large subunit [Candidatus Sedimenticola sp. (ex Thyasira tokunagai)]